MEKSPYLPGKCNIDKKEANKRYTFGAISFLIAGLFTALVVFLKVSSLWEAIVFVPILAGFIGFYQGRLRFCVRNAKIGQYEFPSLGISGKVSSLKDHVIDLSRSRQIFLYSFFSSILVTVILLLAVMYL
ncbi:MAG: hypothetical protein M1441_02115 [Candidatus Parvarchaeota archaeon]|jgi:hypothetical protein|nr:hypothetical protein [Candidatus Parvarchaeota archaeon]